MHKFRHTIKLHWLSKLLPICQHGCSHTNSFLSTHMLLAFSSHELIRDGLNGTTLPKEELLECNTSLIPSNTISFLSLDDSHESFAWSASVSAQAAVHRDTNLKGEEKLSGGADLPTVCRGRACLCSDNLHSNTQLQTTTSRAARYLATCGFCLFWLCKSSGK